MLLTGRQKRDRLRDGRRIYLGSEEVRDVTTHPAFCNAAETIISLYDFKADPANRDLLSYEEDGGRHSLYWLRGRTREDLVRRMNAHMAIAQHSYGMIGRSPDHVAGMLTGLAMDSDVLERLHPGFGQNLIRYYEYARDNDLYIVYAVIPPTGKRAAELFPGQERDDPALRVVSEDAEGVTLSGMKMLATGAAFADEVWIGNLTPIDDKFKNESITCAVPVSAPGVSFWSRQAYGRQARYAADYPLTAQFDESDSVLICDEVKVPWERVFLHNNGIMSRGIYIETPSNAYANHQSNVRFWAKMGLIVGVASQICQANGVDRIPAVREQLGRLAALEATIGAMVHGQIDAYEEWPKGYACPNRRYMYAALNWCQESYSPIIDTLRTLLGGTPLQMPASIDILADPSLKDRFERWWRTPSMEALSRMKLYKLAWDLVGTEFAGRHQLYEKFYAGNSIVVRNQSDREAPWDYFHAVVNKLLDDIETPSFAASTVAAE